MSNDYFEYGNTLIPGQTARAEDVSDELTGVQSGFDKLPKPRSDGQGFEDPIFVGEATDDGHVATRGQLITLEQQAADHATSANQSKLDAESAVTQAQTAQANAETARDAAQTAQANAETAETGANNAISQAQAHRDKAQEWAENNKNVEVETGQYSAKHWSEVAYDNVTQGTASAISQAQAHRDKAQDWAESDKDVQVETGQYSAKHWALHAEEVVQGAKVYQGAWDASSGVYPSNPTAGYFWTISVAGTIDGTAYNVGDEMAYNGLVWERIPSSNAVTSVHGKTGDVTLVPADIGAATSNHGHGNVTPSTAGFMSPSDKTKLDGVASGANNVTNTNQLTDGAQLGDTANWSQIVDDDGNKPANNATVGADWDVNVTNKPTTLNEISPTEAAKLAGIETGATADMTASEILAAVKSLDGSGSGLDADTVDGVQASALQRITDNIDAGRIINVPSAWTQDNNTWRPITDSTGTTDSTVSASATAVKSAYDLAAAALPAGATAADSDQLGGINATEYTQRDVDEVITGNWRHNGTLHTANSLGLTGRNSGNSADIALAALNASDAAEFGAATVTGSEYNSGTGAHSFKNSADTELMSLSNSGNAVILGTVTANGVNLSDSANKALNETIAGTWTFSNSFSLPNANTGIFLNGNSMLEANASQTRVRVTQPYFRVSDGATVTRFTIDTANGDIIGTGNLTLPGTVTANGINLNDSANKALNETITGSWTFGANITFSGSGEGVSLFGGSLLEATSSYTQIRTAQNQFRIADGSGTNRLMVDTTNGNIFPTGSIYMSGSDIIQGGDFRLTSSAVSSVDSTARILMRNGDNTFQPLTQSGFKDLMYGTVVDEHVRAGHMQLLSGNAVPSGFVDADLNFAVTDLTESTWESIGRTGAGKTHTWTIMDILPANATAIVVDLRLSLSVDHNNLFVNLYGAGVETTPTSTSTNLNMLFNHDSDLVGTDLHDSTRAFHRLIIPLANRSMMLNYLITTDATESSVAINLYYRGFITD